MIERAAIAALSICLLPATLEGKYCRESCISVQSTISHDSTPLLVIVSSIMDFPAPGIATPSDYSRLVQPLSTHCPLQHFSTLGLADGDLH